MWHNRPYDEPSEEAKCEAQRLIDSGYRCLSNRYRIIGRIDREDWLEFMAAWHVDGFPGDPEENFKRGMEWATGLGLQAGDFYRSVLSKDHIEGIPESIYRLIRKVGTHGHGNLAEYRPLIPKEKFNVQK